jgi:hypothetical protein
VRRTMLDRKNFKKQSNVDYLTHEIKTAITYEGNYGTKTNKY